MSDYVVFKSNGVVWIDSRDEFNDCKARGRVEELAAFEVGDQEGIPQLVGKEYRAETVHGASITDIQVSIADRMTIAAAVVDLDGVIINVPAIVGDILNAGDASTYELVTMDGLMFAIQRAPAEPVKVPYGELDSEGDPDPGL